MNTPTTSICWAFPGGGEIETVGNRVPPVDHEHGLNRQALQVKELIDSLKRRGFFPSEEYPEFAEYSYFKDYNGTKEWSTRGRDPQNLRIDAAIARSCGSYSGSVSLRSDNPRGWIQRFFTGGNVRFDPSGRGTFSACMKESGLNPRNAIGIKYTGPFEDGRIHSADINDPASLILSNIPITPTQHSSTILT